MTSTALLLSPTARLREYALALPVTAYIHPRETSSLNVMRAVFGSDVTEESLVYCERLGARRNGSTFTFTFPEGAGPGAAVMLHNDMVQPAWEGLHEVGQRIGAVYSVLTSENFWAAPSFVELAVALTDEVIEGNDPFTTGTGTGTGTVSLNWADPVWALAHVLHSLSPDEADEVERVSAQRHSGEDLNMVAERTRAADVLKANLLHVDEVLPLISGAIAQYIEERVTSDKIQDKPLSQGLLQTPRTEWGNEVHRIVARALAPTMGAHAAG